jgi:hypothetical protein
MLLVLDCCRKPVEGKVGPELIYADEDQVGVELIVINLKLEGIQKRR